MSNGVCNTPAAHRPWQIIGSELGALREIAAAAVATCVLTLLTSTPTARAAFSMEDVDFWVGSGANRAALVIDWSESAAEPPALAWGFRWDGAAQGRDMLLAIVAADPRLYAKLGGSLADPTAIYGLGYDADDDGQFSIDDSTIFDENGFALSEPADLAAAIDADDYYAEGWFGGFWHYGVETPNGANPYQGGEWDDSGTGMVGRDLVDGAWDSWVFSPSFDFASFAVNPAAANSPYPPGDFNRDGEIDSRDYDTWVADFGLETHPAVDGNRNGIVDAADYVVWRKNHSPQSPALTTTATDPVPEPSAALLWITSIVGHFAIFRRTWKNRDQRLLMNCHPR